MFSGGIEGDQWHESIYFNGKKPFRSNTIERSTIVITKRCRKNQNQDLISFGQMMKYIQSSFICSLIQIFVVIVVGQHYQYHVHLKGIQCMKRLNEFIKIIT